MEGIPHLSEEGGPSATSCASGKEVTPQAWLGGGGIHCPFTMPACLCTLSPHLYHIPHKTCHSSSGNCQHLHTPRILLSLPATACSTTFCLWEELLCIVGGRGKETDVTGSGLRCGVTFWRWHLLLCLALHLPLCYTACLFCCCLHTACHCMQLSGTAYFFLLCLPATRSYSAMSIATRARANNSRWRRGTAKLTTGMVD